MGGGVAATLPPPGLTHPGPQPQGQGHSMPGLCVSERHSVLCLLLPGTCEYNLFPHDSHFRVCVSHHI